MKALILASLIFLTACAVADRTPEAQKLSSISAADKSNCKFIGYIKEDETGRGTFGRNTESAMNNALNKIANLGGDSYYSVSDDVTYFGSTVILEGYKCRGISSSDTSANSATVAERLKELDALHKSGLVNDSEYENKKQEILKSL